MTGVRPLAVHTGDGLLLEAELSAADAARAVVVLCHAHPQYGGSMRDIVSSVLFSELPRLGFTCLRFNFRGVDGSGGTYTDGEHEPLDVMAGISAISAAAPDAPVVAVGWSFGADMALSVTDPRLAGWVGIASPLRFRTSFAAARDARPKHLVLAEHDEYRSPGDVQEEVAAWANTTTVIVAGASHFFVGRTDQVVAETRRGIDRVVG